MRKTLDSNAVDPGYRRLLRAASIAAVATAISVGMAFAGQVTATAGNTHAAPRDAGGQSTPGPSWQQPHGSVLRAPTDLTAAVGIHQIVRVVSTRVDNGRPAISVRTVTGKSAAATAVAAAQRDNAIAVSIDRKQQFISDPGGIHNLSGDQVGTAGSDPLRAQQWALDTLQAEQVWTQSRGDGVTVAVIDTGSAEVPDLVGQLLPGADLVYGRPDGHGDGHGHGTHVAGIVAAKEGNDIGIAGLAPGVKILPIKVLDDSGSGYWSTLAQGIVLAADAGVDVISMSLGGPSRDPNVETAIEYAQSKGVVVVAAAGNSSDNTPMFPGAFDGVVTVAATDSSDSVASFSTYGPQVDVAAPGVDVLSTTPGGYASWSGTSMATPYVSAEIALILSASRAKGISVDPVAATTSHAVDIADPGRDDHSGYGRLWPLNALCGSGLCTGVPTPIPTPTPTVTPTATPTPTPTSTPTPTPTPTWPTTPADPYVLTFSASPRLISAGSMVVLSGTVNAGSIPLPNHAVRLDIRSRGGIDQRIAYSSPGGLFQMPIYPDAHVVVTASVPDPDHGRVVQAQIAIQVAVRLRLRMAKGTVAVTANPTDPRRLRLQAKTRRGWRTVAIRRYRGNAAISFRTVRHASYRVVADATQFQLQTVSNTFRGW